MAPQSLSHCLTHTAPTISLALSTGSNHKPCWNSHSAIPKSLVGRWGANELSDSLTGSVAQCSTTQKSWNLQCRQTPSTPLSLETASWSFIRVSYCPRTWRNSWSVFYSLFTCFASTSWPGRSDCPKWNSTYLRDPCSFVGEVIIWLDFLEKDFKFLSNL